MADTPDAPDTPAPKRRRAPREPAAAASPPRKRPAKPTAVPTESAPAPAKRAALPKPRSTKRTTPAPKPRRPVEADKSRVAQIAGTIGGRWGTAAIAAAGGAAIAALLTLRGSTPKPAPQPVPPSSNTGGAHQPDGSDSSASFQAGIADEGTIPD